MLARQLQHVATCKRGAGGGMPRVACRGQCTHAHCRCGCLTCLLPPSHPPAPASLPPPCCAGPFSFQLLRAHTRSARHDRYGHGCWRRGDAQCPVLCALSVAHSQKPAASICHSAGSRTLLAGTPRTRELQGSSHPSRSCRRRCRRTWCLLATRRWGSKRRQRRSWRQGPGC